MDRIRAHRGVEPSTLEVQYRGAVLYLDVTGFTKFSEQESSRGPTGAEVVRDAMNVCFERALAACSARGGDALFFAGDAVLVFFAATTDAELRHAVARACASGIDAQRAVSETPVAEGLTLGLRAAVGAGDFVSLEFGGHAGRWLMVFDGEPLDATFVANRVAPDGSVLIPRSIWEACGDVGRAKPVDGTDLLEVLHVVPPPHVASTPPAQLSPEMDEIVAQYLPPMLVDRSRLGLEAWIAEFRPASVLMLNLPDLVPRRADDRARMQRAVEIVQARVAAQDGALRELLHDDKGTTLLVAFGLPPAASEGTATRASQCGNDILTELAAEDVLVQIGVATGTVFSGQYQTPLRRNYSLVGTTVIRAARLMVAAAPGTMLCDTPTQRQAQRQISFEETGALELRGIPGLVHTFRPIRRTSREERNSGVHPTMLGRADELQEGLSAMRAFVSTPAPTLLVIVGEAGLGKSVLLDRLTAAAPCRVLYGAAEAVESATPYYAWRPVFAALLGTTLEASRDAQRAAVQHALASLLPEAMELVPLLSQVLPLDIADTDRTRFLTGSVRAEALENLLVGILQRQAALEPLCIAIEDLQWLDGASWRLMRAAQRAQVALFILATTRPLGNEDGVSKEVTDRGRVLELPPLSSHDIAQIVCRRIGVDSVPEKVLALIQARSEGQPFFAEELAATLVETKALRIVGSRAVLGNAARGGVTELPETIVGVIASRIDRLGYDTALTLKIASVIGRRFEDRCLVRIHPPPESAVPTQLGRLRDASLVQALDAAEPTHHFRHALTQETAYGTLPVAQRRPLHRATAEFLERAYHTDLSPHYARLAYHWTEAAVLEKACMYLGLAGQQALASSAVEEAERMLRHALEIDHQLRGRLRRDFQRARWYRWLGEACYAQGKYEAAGWAFERTFEMAGFEAPAANLEMPRALAQAIAVWASPGLVPLSDAEKPLALEALRAYDQYIPTVNWLGKSVVFLNAIIVSSALARRAGRGDVQSRPLSYLGYLMTMVGLVDRGIARASDAVEMSEEAQNGLHLVANLVLLGMACCIAGRGRQAEPALRRAHLLAETYGIREWRHRAAFMLNEALMQRGAFAEACQMLESAAAAARGVEDPVVGFANGLRALHRLRMGEDAASCLATIDGPEGLVATQQSTAHLQTHCCLGARAECLLELGELRQCLATCRQAMALAADGNETFAFLRGLDAHWATTACLLRLVEIVDRPGPRIAGVPERDVLLALADGSLRNLGRLGVPYRAARPALRMAKGWRAALGGDERRAERHLLQAWAASVEMDLAWEQVESAWLLSRFGKASARDEWRSRSAALAHRYGLQRLAERATSR